MAISPFQQPPDNRVLDLVKMMREQEVHHFVERRLDLKDNVDSLQLTRKNYQSIAQSFRRGAKLTGAKLTSEERKTLRYVRHQIRRINRKLQPRLAQKLVQPLTWLIKVLVGRQSTYKRHDKILKALDKSVSVDTNVKSLLQQMQSRGFTNNSLQERMAKFIASNANEFHLRYYDINYKNSDFVLSFKKIPGTRAYQLEKWETAAYRTPEDIARGNQAVNKLTYSVTDKLDFSAKDSVTLSEGRPVLKVIDGEKTWLTYNPLAPGGLTKTQFDVYTALSAFPLAELKDEGSRKALVNALEAGNEREVTLKTGQRTAEQVKVSLGPDAQELVFHNMAGQRVNVYQMLHVNNHLEKLQKASEQLNLKQNTPRLHHGPSV